MKPDQTEPNLLFPTVRAAFTYLENFTNFEKRSAEPGEYRLDRMSALLEICGKPQDACPAIHIAGSKGKGSTAHFCGAILHQGHYRVGIYASPHLSDYRERICSPTGFYSDLCYISVISQVRRLVEKLDIDQNWQFGEPSTFELLTLTAYLVFAREKVQWMIIETGLGGRLDATNLMHPRACLITALELEHTDVLGNTIEEITREKAGIFRKNTFLLTQEQNPRALEELLLAAQRLNTPLLGPGFIQTDNPEPDRAKAIFRIWLPKRMIYMDISVKLSARGAFQQRNAEIAARCLALLWDDGQLPEIPNLESLSEAIRNGLAQTGIMGRLQSFTRVRQNLIQEIFLDGAHTPRSAELVGDYFQAKTTDILLFGCVSGKLHEQMASILASGFGKIIISTPGSFKKSDPTAVAAAFNLHNSQTILVKDPKQALETVLVWLDAHPQGRGLVCGSFYMAGAILPYLLSAGFIPEGKI